MVLTKGFLALLMSCMVCSAVAAVHSGYKLGVVKKIERGNPPYASTPLEDKRFFDCDDFKISDKDIKFVLKRAKQVSKRYYADEITSIGCHADIFVTFKNGDRVFFGIEPIGRIFAHVENGPKAGKRYYYYCQRCLRR
jgi:hypothetical protein